MPNWCYNKLRVLGDEKDVQDFVKKAKGKDTELSLNNFVPMPKELENTRSPAWIVKEKEYEQAVKKEKKESKKSGFALALPITKKMSKEFFKKFGADNWYDWNTKNWGTKWNARGAKLIDEWGDGAEYTFDTAWSSPLAWLEKVSLLYPNTDFLLKYEGEGMEFIGVAKANDGKVWDRGIDC
ncbi:hypothetical protein MYX76_09530 [Desulfobacterota bacterium AH_259_B03_O07]|nr:hypothetical protein [Desulfobacterota bacterium AH_259_B03_O07]